MIALKLYKQIYKREQLDALPVNSIVKTVEKLYPDSDEFIDISYFRKTCPTWFRYYNPKTERTLTFDYSSGSVLVNSMMVYIESDYIEVV